MQTQQYETSGEAGLAAGVVLGGTYRIIERLASGGMGEVYLAAHERLARQLAIKVLSRDLVSNEEAFVRFGREAAILSSLRHPNIVQVIDFNVTDEGTPFLAMELLEGPDLRLCIEREGRLRPARVARVVRQVASALAAAHEHGIVHRDLKPDNVVLLPVRGQEDFVKVLDFGISKVLWSERLTGVRHVIGTPQYMAPEQAQGRLEEIDVRTDQFALAALAWAMLTGRAPFRGETPAAVLYQVVNEEPEPLARHLDVPCDAIDEVIRRGMSKRREDRFPDVMAFADALDEAVRAPPAPRPMPVIIPSALPAAIRTQQIARPRVPARAAVALVGAAALVAAFWFGGRHATLPASLDAAGVQVRRLLRRPETAAPPPLSVAAPASPVLAPAPAPPPDPVVYED